jgi:nucleoside-diphosphate-sugar epimerase
MRILITGNMGYIGPVVVRHLRRTMPAAQLFGVDTGYFALSVTNTEVLPESRLDAQYFQDVRQISSDLLKNVDAIVHLAAISNDPMGNRYEQVTLDINYQATVRLAEQAKAAGVKRFVFASSCSVYGCAADDARTEESSLDPLTAYAKSKVLSEEGLQKLASPNFQVSCLRFATACGMSERLRLDLVLNDFVASAMATGQITILSDGTPWRPLIHVEDMARAIEWALGRKDGGDFLIVNVGSNQWNYQVKDLAKAVASAFDNVTVSTNKDAPPDKRSYQVDFSKYKKLAPAHLPQVGLTEAVRGLKEGLEKMNFHDKDFRKSQYMRLNIISQHRSENRLNDVLQWVK